MNNVIEIKGLNNALQKVQRMSDEIKQKVSFELQASCITIVANAKRNAAKNFGLLANGITYVKKSQLSFEIVSAANYSAYMEFGTKTYVSIPSGFEALANKFKGASIDSGGKTLKQAIEAWAISKGIPADEGILIYLHIKKYGVQPHPFLIPAYTDEVPNLLKRIKTIVSNAE